jgi:hypothetical protein
MATLRGHNRQVQQTGGDGWEVKARGRTKASPADRWVNATARPATEAPPSRTRKEPTPLDSAIPLLSRLQGQIIAAYNDKDPGQVLAIFERFDRARKPADGTYREAGRRGVACVGRR